MTQNMIPKSPTQPTPFFLHRGFSTFPRFPPPLHLELGGGAEHQTFLDAPLLVKRLVD